VTLREVDASCCQTGHSGTGYLSGAGLQVSLYFLYFLSPPIFPYIVYKCPIIPIILLFLKIKLFKINQTKNVAKVVLNFVLVDVTGTVISWVK